MEKTEAISRKKAEAMAFKYIYLGNGDGLD
jgi:hypothetical protein